MPSESEVAIRITVFRPPSGVAFAVQRGGAELLAPTLHGRDALVFDFSVRVSATQPGATPRLLGPFAQGPPAARFVYVNAGQRAGQLTSKWNRRAKVPLGGITPSLLQSAAGTPGARIETQFEGTGRDGGPTCATVKMVEWRVTSPSSDGEQAI
jgi:hypothetical protein